MKIKQQTSASPYPISYDLENCDQEPLHLIQHIQNHACLIACTPETLEILHVTDNAEEKTGHAYLDLYGNHISTLLSPKEMEQLSPAKTFLSGAPVQVTFKTGAKKTTMNCVSYRHNGLLLLEFEPSDHSGLDLRFQHETAQAIQLMQQESGLSDLFQTAATQVKRLSGYDRVLIYRFDREGHGEVVGEAKESDLEPFLGLHYPATDIPAQARDLYLKNPVRMICDLLAAPAVVYPTLTPTTGQPLDLTYCSSRGVSPIHIEYLTNMGVRASMSIAIVVDEKLWGLIACHHYSPKFVDFYMRNTMLFMGKIISGHLSLRTVYDFRQSVLQVNVAKSRLFEQMLEKSDLHRGLMQEKITLLDMNNCGGAALYSEDVLQTLGNTPNQAQLLALVDWLGKRTGSHIFYTDELPAHYPPALDFKDTAAGLLSVRIASRTNNFVMWFRPEELQTVQWGGNPTKSLTKTENGIRLSPRKSFEKWSQVVQNKSLPWVQHEIDAAFALCNDIREFITQKFANLSLSNRALKDAYEEMETFSYSISHDLRTPLRSIEGFANILKEDYAERLDDYGKKLIETILLSTIRMDRFIQDILTYSRLGRKHLDYNLAQVETVIREIADEMLLASKVEGRKVNVTIAEKLPMVYADRLTLEQVVSNLLSNAFKYTRQSEDPRIEIGGGENEEHSYLYVRDNGIGFDPAFTDRIFGIFNRLVLEEEFEGTGVGLAIVKRVLEKHGGTVTVESSPGQGATFTVFFPKKPGI